MDLCKCRRADFWSSLKSCPLNDVSRLSSIKKILELRLIKMLFTLYKKIFICKTGIILLWTYPPYRIQLLWVHNSFILDDIYFLPLTQYFLITVGPISKIFNILIPVLRKVTTRNVILKFWKIFSDLRYWPAFFN